MKPIWMAQLDDEVKRREIQFEEIFALKPRIVSLALVYETNSYFVHVHDAHFVVNGGRKLAVPNMVVPQLICIRRHTRRMRADLSGILSEERAFLLGLKEGRRIVALWIDAARGDTWQWRNSI